MSKRIIYECSIKIDDTDFHVLLDDNYCGHAALSPIHDHPVFEAHFIQEGKYKFQINDEIIILSSHTGCLIKPNIYHSILPLEPVSVKYCFKFYTLNKTFLSSQIIKSYKWKHGIFIFEQATKEIGYLKEILSEYEHRDAGYKSSIDSLFTLLVLAISRKVIDLRRPEEAQQSAANFEVLVNEVDAFLYRNYMKDISLADMARHMKISERQVNRLMFKLYGSSFKQKVIQIRITAAKDLLLQNNRMTIAKIAEAVGYKNQYYFTNVFKKTTGVTPEEFAKTKEPPLTLSCIEQG